MLGINFVKAYYTQHQTELLLIFLCIWFLTHRYFISHRSKVLKNTCELHETNSQKNTNIKTHQLTKIELATWNPGFFVDLLDAEWRHLCNSNQGRFSFQIASYLYFISGVLFKQSIFHIYLNFSMNALKSKIWWSCLHKITHTVLNNCLACASNIWYINRCLPYNFFSHSRSKQHTILTQMQVLLILSPQLISNLFLEDTS